MIEFLLLIGVSIVLFSFNSSKTKILFFSRLRQPLKCPDTNLQQNDLLRLLGQRFSTDMKWKYYTESISRTAARKIGSLCHTRQILSIESILPIESALLRIMLS